MTPCNSVVLHSSRPRDAAFPRAHLMKFAASLDKNILESWKLHYMHYSGLKKIIHFPPDQFLQCLEAERLKSGTNDR